MTNTARKTVLITGAAHRIGKALALDLAAHGWDVAVHYHSSAEAAEQVAAEIRALGRQACIVQADLAVEAETRAVVPAASQALGPLTCLINNASLFENDTAENASRASWDAHMETNLRAPFVLIQDFASQLVGDGNVINLIDERVFSLTPYFTTYTLSKAGLWALTQTLALALAPRIRVNGIGPGPALPSKRQTQEQFDQQCQAMPLQRGTSPAEICRAARFILDAASMTGQMIALDGGQHLGWAPDSRSAPEE